MEPLSPLSVGSESPAAAVAKLASSPDPDQFSEISLDEGAEKTAGTAPRQVVNFADVPAPVKKSEAENCNITNGNEKLPAGKTTVIHQTETEDETFSRLKSALESGEIDKKQVVDAVFQVLVGGPLDLESKFVIQKSSSILKMVDLIDTCSPDLQAELWSVFVALARKSQRNLECCSEIGLTTLVLARLENADDVVADLLIELLTVLTQYSVSVKEIKQFLKMVQANENNVWRRHSAKLLHVMKQMPKKEGPDTFFSFPGAPGAGLALPPVSKWPQNAGWTFCAWLRLDPQNGVHFERERPVVYSFGTKGGLGYSCHVLGNCLVITVIKVRAGRGYTRCVRRELSVRRWHHVVVSHVYSRWGRSEIQCFVDGQLADTIDMAWPVNSNEHFEKCFIGCGPNGEADASFCGQMGAIYIFAEALSLQQVNSIFCLGPHYQSTFKYEAECELPDGYKRHLFDGRLSTCLMAAYCPNQCDPPVCLECALGTAGGSNGHFVHTPHGVMRNGTAVVATGSVHAALHSVGGMHVLLPLFYQLDVKRGNEDADGDQAMAEDLCSTLLQVICNLLETSAHAQTHFFQNKGFLVISDALAQAKVEHLNEKVLDTLLAMARYLLQCANGPPLVKQLFDFILFNPALWIHTPAQPQRAQTQLRLYTFLANDFLASGACASAIRRTSTVLQMLHALKYFYWLVDPSDRSGFAPKGTGGQRPCKEDIVKIRACLLLFIRKLVLKGPDENENRDDELQAMFNFVATVHEDDNVYDLLATLTSLMQSAPAHFVPGFDRKRGVAVSMKLLAAPNELVRLPALKILGYFLSRATAKRKQDVMGSQNLFTLITERLLLNSTHLTLATYNALFEILTEQMSPLIQYDRVAVRIKTANDTHVHFENPAMLKVIANLIAQSEPCQEVMNVKEYFLNDVIALCVDSKENRRTILQMSVWQEWLVSLSHVLPDSVAERRATDLVLKLFGILLQHAVMLEYGGWRVWVDTMAIVHSKVSFEKFRRHMARQNNRAYLGYRVSSSTGSFKDQFLKDVHENVEQDVRDVLDGIVESVLAEESVYQQQGNSLAAPHASQPSSAGTSPRSTVDTAGAGRRHKGSDAKRASRPTSATGLAPASASGAAPSAIYRTPEFRWSEMHVRLLHDLLTGIENEVETWKKHCQPPSTNGGGAVRSIGGSGAMSNTLLDVVNSAEQTVLVANTIHVLSQLVDSLVMAAGGLLPLLAAATSPNSELEIGDSTGQGLDITSASRFLIRFSALTDTFLFSTAVQLSELEQEKNMPAGGILRQALRLVCTVAVRNILSSRDPFEAAFVGSPSSEAAQRQASRRDAIKTFIAGGNCDGDEKLTAMLKVAAGLADPEHLLQESDLIRLKATVYRDVEEHRAAQFLALAVTYFLSVLMVSRYRDILEPPSSPSPFFDTGSAKRHSSAAGEHQRHDAVDVLAAQNGGAQQHACEQNGLPAVRDDNGEKCSEDSAKDRPPSPTTNGESTTTATGAPADETAASDSMKSGSPAKPIQEIASISIKQPADVTNPANVNDGADLKGQRNDCDVYGPEQLSGLQPRTSQSSGATTAERRVWLTEKLSRALDTCAPLLREIMGDFRTFMQRTLLGTHGQEIMNDTKVMATLRNPSGSVIELVMLLCSQEWQTSLQKHAGLAFIELVNEGRLMAHATRDHILRVANEADFILNRLRADDVARHAEFEAAAAAQLYSRKEEERTCDHLISAARRRDRAVANRINERILNILLASNGAWAQCRLTLDNKDCGDKTPPAGRRVHWKLDVWEDDSRRRKRFVPDPFGGYKYALAAPGDRDYQKQNTAFPEELGSQDSLERAREELLAHLIARKIVVPHAPLPPAAGAGEIIDENEISNWSEMEEQNSEDGAAFTARARLLAPGLVVPGIVSVTGAELFFDCDENDPEFAQLDPRVLRYCENLHGRWHFAEIRAIFLRRYLLQNTALELFLASRTTILVAFDDHTAVKRVVRHLPRVGVGVKYGLPQSRKASLMTARQLFKHSDMSEKWQRREISNFDYLMFLNTIAASGRFVDRAACILRGKVQFVAQRRCRPPIPLWDTLFYRAFYMAWGLAPSCQKVTKKTPRHAAAFTLNWLVRLEPFTSMHAALHGARLDQADRIFHSINESWLQCQRDSHDVKELIPELFCVPEMLRNDGKVDMGSRSDDDMLDDVKLPPWAESPEQFVQIHRQALESDLVSCQLHQWIDLIFGYKQRGPEAVRATNVFYYLTYEGSINLAAVSDATERAALEAQLRNFGQTPAQLLTEPHPPRQSVMTISPMIFQPVSEDLVMIMKFISNSPVVHLSANTHQQLSTPTVVSVAANLGYALNRWNNSYTGAGVAPSFPVASASGGGGASGSGPLTPGGSTAPPLTPGANPGASAGGHDDSQQSVLHALPLTVDPLLAAGNPATPLARRHLGDALDQKLRIQSNTFATTVDSKYIFACGYPDYSFRVIDTDSARVRQVVYGHRNVVTCIGRSECNLLADCYIATGSRDCTVLLWHWAARPGCVAGEHNAQGERPAPRAVLTGHDTQVLAVAVSAEHGVVVSGSDGPDGVLLVHTTMGELLRCIAHPDASGKSSGSPVAGPARLISLSRECLVTVAFHGGCVALFTLVGRCLTRIKVADEWLCTCATRDGEYLMCGDGAGTVRVYRTFGLQLLHSYQQCDSPIRSIALAHNHRFILAGLSSGAVVVYNVDFNKWHYEYKQRYTKR